MPRRHLGGPLLIILLGSTIQVRAQDDLPRGQVIDKVACLKRPEQTYALYLPSNYSAQTPHAVLYCFDPAARGRVPVELFKVPAEQLGYIVVGSNNSRNGPWAPIQEAIQAVWEDTRTRFALDLRRVYTAGMSGGGGPAWALAGSGAAGTIICASVLEAREEVLRDVSFACFSIAGLADFNYPYLDEHTETLLKLGKPARFETFEGGHAWPPASLASEALRWMELQAMKSGVKPRDATFLDSEFQRRQQLAASLETEGKLWESWTAWRCLCLDFAGFRDVQECGNKAAALNQEKKVRDRRKELAEMAESQKLRERRLQRSRAILERPQAALVTEQEELQEEFVARAQNELHEEISQLKKRLTRPVYDRDRIVSQRVLDGFFIGSLYYARDLLDGKDYQPAIAVLEICLQVRPNNAGLHFDLARAYAGHKDKRKALSNLEKAVDAGFKDPERIRATQEFAPLQNEPRFQQILTRLSAPE